MRGAVLLDQRAMAAIDPSLHALGKAVRRIEVARRRRSQQQKDFLANVPSLKSVSTLTPLSSPVVELLIARLGRDDLDLWRR